MKNELDEIFKRYADVHRVRKIRVVETTSTIGVLVEIERFCTVESIMRSGFINDLRSLLVRSSRQIHVAFIMDDIFKTTFSFLLSRTWGEETEDEWKCSYDITCEVPE